VTIITRPATDNLGRIHDRMPVVVPRDLTAAWLDPDLTNPVEVRELLASIPDPQLEPREVGREVGAVRNNSPRLIAPLVPAITSEEVEC
jgi:putative SOS response-associated peptidase YedK